MRDHLINFLDNKSDRLDQLNIPRNSFISNFMRELQHTLEKWRSFEAFQRLPRDPRSNFHTSFIVAGYSDNFIELLEDSRREIFFVPKEVVLKDLSAIPPLGHPLRFWESGNLYLDKTGSGIGEHQIPYFRERSTIAK